MTSLNPGENSILQRKGTGLFKKSSLSRLTPLNTQNVENSKGYKTRAGKRSSLFNVGPSSSSDVLDDEASSPTLGDKSRTLHKNRPGSLFGSLGRKSTNPLVLETDLTDSPPISPADVFPEPKSALQRRGSSVLHHGEVQTTSGLFRKKKEYLVLTDSHLVRFKSLSRATEVFPSLLSSNLRVTASRHSSTNSIGSLAELQSLTSRSSSENEAAIPLHQIVAAYKFEDGRPLFTTEVVYLDDEANASGTLQLMLHDPKEADLWHTSIRGASQRAPQRARLLADQLYPARLVRYLAHILEAVDDYDQHQFKMFRVVRRIPTKVSGRSSSDELTKVGSSVWYMVIGINLLHLISLPDFSSPSIRYLEAKSNKSSYGLVSLTSMDVQHSDDSFELTFRAPVQPMTVLELAASAAPEIATLIFNSILYLKPQWLDYTFLFSGPPGVIDDSNAPSATEEENGCFDRTLIAYCAAYNCDVRNVRYAVDLEVEDAPEFRLFPPAATEIYSVLELLAIFRALRYNESFGSVSFSGINLDNLHALIDIYGSDHVAHTSRSGRSGDRIARIKPDGRSLLFQEVQALALKSKRIRRLNFSDTLPKRSPRDFFDEEGQVNDPGCEIAAALMPLCRGQLTNVDWIIFSGIELGEADLEEFVPALDDRMSRFRCLDVSRCGLSDRGLQIFVKHLEKQCNSMDCINIAGNPGHLNLSGLSIVLSRFGHIRKLNLSRATNDSGDSPLMRAEVMLAWRLEELVLTGIPINNESIDAISIYLASDSSMDLRYLEMQKCNLEGSGLAMLFRAMVRNPGEARNLHFDASSNDLGQHDEGGDELAKAIENSLTPSHLTIRLIEYQDESQFRRLLQAMRVNKTIRVLDIAQSFLPYDAGEDTCNSLFKMFEDNTTLEELDISGEDAQLDFARFGTGLSTALAGLELNETLLVLRIEHQNLGHQGACTLASVLELNTSLREVYCQHNGFSLQAVTTLVNSIAGNFSIIALPFVHEDKKEAVRSIKGAIREQRLPNDGVLKHSVLKTLTSLGVHKKDSQNQNPTPQDVENAVSIVASRWNAQIQRLEGFLQRNNAIARGEASAEDYSTSVAALRPVTPHSDNGIVEMVMSNTTPKIELANPIDAMMQNRLQVLGLRNGSSSDVLPNYGIDTDSRPRSSSQLTAKRKSKIFSLGEGSSTDDPQP